MSKTWFAVGHLVENVDESQPDIVIVGRGGSEQDKCRWAEQVAAALNEQHVELKKEQNK